MQKVCTVTAWLKCILQEFGTLYWTITETTIIEPAYFIERFEVQASEFFVCYPISKPFNNSWTQWLILFIHCWLIQLTIVNFSPAPAMPLPSNLILQATMTLCDFPAPCVFYFFIYGKICHAPLATPIATRYFLFRALLLFACFLLF